MTGEGRSPDAPEASAESAPLAPDFRWQALFQRAREPLFVLDRRRRILFVNRAWERLTGLSAAEARGLACIRRPPSAQDPADVVIRSLCCPPPEALKGNTGRARRLVPGSGRSPAWWDLEFFPLHDPAGLLCILGKIAAATRETPAAAGPLPEKLLALRDGVRQRHGLEQLASRLPALGRVLDQVRLASQTDVPVLLVGEPGTGKQWVARTIQAHSAGREGALACLDCARLPASTLAALLFGDAGLARQAAPGTQYLREIGRLPRDLQARLADRLREPGAGPRLRTLAGCSEDPVQAVRAGRLVEDLYYALAALVITLPPLRDRREDLPALVERFLERAGSETGRRSRGLTAEAWEIVRVYPWPGNLRELYAVLQQAARRAPGEWIDAGHLPAALRLAVRLDQTAGPETEKPLPLKQLLEQAERRLIILALRKAQGNRSRAADLLAVWRPYLLRRMAALEITPQEYGVESKQ